MDSNTDIKPVNKKKPAPIPSRPNSALVVAVTSGKGGVGKTNVVANVAVNLSKAGLKTLILDADMGLGNIDVLLGLTPKYNIQHLLTGEKRLSEVLVRGPAGILILPAASGVFELTDLSQQQKMAILAELEAFTRRLDVVLIDTGAGISSNVIYFNALAHEIIVIAAPEPTSITDAYALIKVMGLKHAVKNFNLLVNSVKNEREAKEVYRTLNSAAQRFLNISINYLGYVTRDDHLQMAVRQQQPLAEAYPFSPANKCFETVANDINLMRRNNQNAGGGAKFFWKGFLSNPGDMRLTVKTS
ncbi:MAG: MinD/ParA family protein [Deltaproteobacteria bacterium]|nr:MinD/ParA family protein [Deltaproteobacteria bacterium]MBF0526085.1 MinD/ParA family protein [Deltaproteobacteria bacterium]